MLLQTGFVFRVAMTLFPALSVISTTGVIALVPLIGQLNKLIGN